MHNQKDSQLNNEVHENPVHEKHQKHDWSTFISSVFFVLGFSLIFSVVGILLQTVLSHATHSVEMWLDWVGGTIIILFGLFLLGLFTPRFLRVDHKVLVKKRFNSYWLTSFVFGAAFAVGWTPCVSAALGAILALAATAPGSAFFLLFAYTLGIGVPFLLVGLFTDRAQRLIDRASTVGGGKWLKYFEWFFGALLVLIGIFIFTGELSQIANIPILTDILTSLQLTTTTGGGISSLSVVNVVIALLAGLGSFLSPCILPIIPGFLSYLASTATSTATSKRISDAEKNDTMKSA
jgi:cytochrome c-type biogenesis protein